jgi:hypothetical protein
MSVQFPASWCAEDLGEYRACDYTYCDFPIDTLPPLDESRFTGIFEWLGDQGDTVPEQKARMDAIDEELARVDLKLPLDFVAFQTRSKLRSALDEVSVAGCWSHLVGPVPSPVEHGAYLVQFLRDQQDCCVWYLYLRRGETFVVHSSYLDWYVDPDQIGHDPDQNDDKPEISVDELPARIYWCAPTFEQFAYRFWLENSLWRVLHGIEGAGEMTAGQRDYLRHYDSNAVE